MGFTSTAGDDGYDYRILHEINITISNLTQILNGNCNENAIDMILPLD